MELVNYDLPLKDGWKFHLGDLPRKQNMPIAVSHQCCKAGGAVLDRAAFDDSVSWSHVSLPHDWLTELELDQNADAAGGFKQRGIGWYYLHFKLPQTTIKNAYLVFDGVLGYTTVFVNGVAAARNFSGYNRFSCDVSAYLLPGEDNEIFLQVDASRFEGWWYEGAGLYRPVRIEFRDDTYFLSQDCFVRSKKENDTWVVKANLSIIGEGNIIADLFDPFCNCVGHASGNQIEIPVETPVAWSPEFPALYKLVCKVLKDGRVVDTYQSSVGLRDIAWFSDKGMYLNGDRYQVKGICCHQDHAGVGAAVSDALMEKRILTLKAMGVNAYRCAHHAPSESLLDICDRLGMLVMVENRHFDLSEDTLKQVDAMVKLARNHPCVFLYSLFNEEPWQSHQRGKMIANGLKERILIHDSTRAVTGAQNGGMLEKSNASDVLDVVGINYFLKDYNATHIRLPQKVIIGTENCPTYATRGVYQSDSTRQIFAQYGEEWGSFSESLDETMEAVYSKPFVAGCFVWCGFDHRGEPTPYGWPSVVSHWGLLDDCGFAKDTAYLLAAWYCEDLCVHILPHWNWEDGETVRVCAYTNADKAELFLNGKSLGVASISQKKAFWSVPFAPGELTVVADRAGQSVTTSVCTAGKPAKIVAEDWLNHIINSDIRVINIAVKDENDVLVPDFDDEVTFTVSDGIVLGIGNGDPNSHHHQKASRIRIFHGRAQIIVKAGATVKIKCAGLPEVVI